MTDIDFDRTESDLQIGIEVEYPEVSSGDDFLVHRGAQSMDLQRQINSLPHGLGNPVYDGTVGLEVVSSVLDLADAVNWYKDVIEHIEEEWGAKYQPVGLLKNGSTAGTHIHFSSVSETKAQRLADISEEPWMQVLFCSSIANDEERDNENTITWPVFRGGDYCRFGYREAHTRNNHYHVVNQVSGGHYEWRLPEPMLPGNMEILTKFLGLFMRDEELAIEYAQELLDNGDERITSIQRAERLGLDIEETPEVRNEPVFVSDETEEFFREFNDDWRMPDIVTVEVDGQPYYVLESDMNGTVTVQDVTVSTNDVVRADSLEAIDDTDIYRDVRRVWSRAQKDERRSTEATDELKKVLKKKKGVEQ